MSKAKQVIDKSTFTAILRNEDLTKGFLSTRDWASFDKKQKRNFIISLFVCLIAFALCCFYLVESVYIHDYFKSLTVGFENAILKWLLEHVPSLFDTIVAIIAYIVLFRLLKMLQCVIKYKSQKQKTIIKMIISITNYLLFVVLVLIVLAAWGVDTVAIIASAGILSLIIGLGAQSIVSDFISGLFIVIEGNIRVGDIVIYEDFVGTVREIGLRVTLIQNINNYTQIVRNSEIAKIVNTSKGETYNKLNFIVPHNKMNSHKVDELFKNNLDTIKACHPDIDKVYYIGIVEFTHFGANYCVAFTCNQKRVIQAKEAIYDCLYKHLESMGIYDNK